MRGGRRGIRIGIGLGAWLLSATLAGATLPASVTDRQFRAYSECVANTPCVRVDGSAVTQPITGTVTPHQDVARTRVTFTADQVTPATTDTLVTFTLNKGGTATAGQTTYTVTAGKTFRVQAVHVGLVDTSATTAIAARVALRENPSGTCSVAASAPLVLLTTASPAALAQAGSSGTAVVMPDGLELPAGDSLCISAVASATTGTLTVTVIGFEY